MGDKPYMRLDILTLAVCTLGLTACASAPAHGDSPYDDEPETRDEGEKSNSSANSDTGKTNAGKAASASGDAGTSSTGSSGSSGTGKDAGKPIVSVTSSSSGSAAANPLDAITGLFGGESAGDGGAKAAATYSDGGLDHCAELICFDIFDCALWHGDALDCGFTKCEGFICAK